MLLFAWSLSNVETRSGRFQVSRFVVLLLLAEIAEVNEVTTLDPDVVCSQVSTGSNLQLVLLLLHLLQFELFFGQLSRLRAREGIE